MYQLETTSIDPGDAALLRQVHDHWISGNTSAAIHELRGRANQNCPWAAALTAWLLRQMEDPSLNESIDWAIKAAELGLSGQIGPTFAKVLAQLPEYPNLIHRLHDLLKWSSPGPDDVDLIYQGLNLVASGESDVALQVMSMVTTLPATNSQWNVFGQQIRERTDELAGILDDAREQRDSLGVSVKQAETAIDKARGDLETSAKQAGLLVTTISSDATNAHFKADAKRNEKESAGAWRWGLIILGAAAVVALLPVVLHYLNVGPRYSSGQQIGVHFASTVALASFAGVLLARARSRDQAAQRAYDLSTAMGTMISYSNQISDPVEKERFTTAMGQVVLQAHLTSGTKSGSKDESVAGMLALANLMKPAAS